MLKEIKKSKIRIKRNRRNIDDTLNITKELQKSLTIEAKKMKEEEERREIRKKMATKVVAVLSVVVLVVLLGAGYIWSTNTYGVNEDYIKYSSSGDGVTVVNNGGEYVVFPTNGNAKTGVIIYPSEKTDTRSYLKLSNMLARDGYRVVITKYMFNYPAIAKNPAKKVIDSNSDIKNWYIVAHSRSGELALRNAANEKNVSGVAFMGAYPIGDNLKLINKPVLTIWGTQDGIIDFTKFEEYKQNLPEKSYLHEIVGGNNTGFSDSKTFEGDNQPTIDRDEQQKKASDYIDSFIKETNALNT